MANLGQPKINDFNGRIRVGTFEQEVLRLQIPVGNFEFVAVIDRVQDLPEHFGCVVFVEELFLNNLVEQLTSRTHLGDEVNIGFVLEIFIELDDTWMVQLLENLDFLLEPLPVLDLLAIDDLDRPVLVGALVRGLVDDAVSATAQGCIVHCVYLVERMFILDDHAATPDHRLSA